MSADNWAICPRCKDAAEKQRAELEERATAAYGVLPVDEWEALREEANKPIDVPTHFREDYEIGQYDGEFYIDYRGQCTDCGLHHTFNHRERIYGEAVSA